MSPPRMVESRRPRYKSCLDGIITVKHLMAVTSVYGISSTIKNNVSINGISPDNLSLLIYYRFTFRLQIGLDFLIIAFLLYFFLSPMPSLSTSSSVISAFTISNHVFRGILPSAQISIHSSTKSLFNITRLYHLSLPLLMTVVIGSTPTSFLNVHQSFTDIHPSIHSKIRSTISIKNVSQITKNSSHTRSPARSASFPVHLASSSVTPAGEYLFRAAHVWWRCAQYFVIVSCG